MYTFTGPLFRYKTPFRVGSIGDNRLGGWYGYRMSKAALNMANKNLSIENGRGKHRVVCLCLHPGIDEYGNFGSSNVDCRHFAIVKNARIGIVFGHFPHYHSITCSMLLGV